jgi:nucleotide-binding universal stress UspA family protein
MAGFVVGVDGSPDAHRALEWALKEAAAHRVPLTVLAIHEVAASAWTGSAITYAEDDPLVEKTRKAAEETVAKAAAQLTEPPPITVKAGSGVPAHSLIDASRDADLVIVGSRGAGGFARLVMGSVSNQVAHHAHCPVVIIPSKI